MAVEVELRIEHVDDEKSKISDFAISNPVSITGGVNVGGAVISQIPRLLNNAANSLPFISNGNIAASPKAVGIAAAVGVGLIAAGAIHAYATRETHSGLTGLTSPVQTAPEKSPLKKAMDMLDKFSPLP